METRIIKDDLCLHGFVKMQIGDAIIKDYGTVSATALCLLRTLEKDKIMSDEQIQMIPCCGNTLIANDDLSEVEIIGCDTGTDWSVIHMGDKVKIVLQSGDEFFIPISEYKSEVFKFADKVETFYKQSKPRQIEGEFDENGYTAFWNEFKRRKM